MRLYLLEKAFTLAKGVARIDTCKGNHLKAFTLSETLITLGIIGIVAAMTLPSLIEKHQKQETSAKLKKFYTTMNQAVMMSEIDNGDMRFWDFNTEGYKVDGKKDHAKVSELCENFFNRYLKKYLKYYSYEKGLNTSDENGATIFTTNRIIFYDGTIAYLNAGSCYDLFFDTNGDRKPNQNGRDRFAMYLCPYGQKNKLTPNEKVTTAASPGGNDRNGAYNLCKKNAYLCARLLQIDNWEFKSDYPWW